MSLYYEAADLITSLGNSQDTSLKSLLFSKTKKPETGKTRKSNPAQLYALITESWKWATVLKEVIERAGILTLERKLAPQLALVLVHDLLLAKKGIAAPDTHGIRQAVERHKARLRAEFTKARIRSGFVTVEEWQSKLEGKDRNNVAVSDVNGGTIQRHRHPRWLRINLLRGSSSLLRTKEFEDWQQVDDLEEILSAQSTKSRVYHVDKHIPDLLAFPPGTDLSLIAAYKRGELISQDKASCFPAYLLSSGDGFSGDILDACAAPGNKTSHIAAILSERHRVNAYPPIIYATERDPQRAEILTRMLKIVGTDNVKILAGQDFLKLDVNAKPWNTITAIILDPSCSGSGIVDRGQIMTFDLPSITATNHDHSNTSSRKSRSKKRPRTEPITTTNDNNNNNNNNKKPKLTTIKVSENDDDNASTTTTASSNIKDLETRLRALSSLQTKMLIYAFSFPNLTRITYSTCSIHDEENEAVVIAALSSDTAKNRGWRVMKRNEQISGMQAWERRGKIEACRSASSAGLDAEEIAEACMRCEPFTKEGTQGFFVAGFVRDVEAIHCQQPKRQLAAVEDNNQGDEEWEGFDD